MVFQWCAFGMLWLLKRIADRLRYPQGLSKLAINKGSCAEFSNVLAENLVGVLFWQRCKIFHCSCTKLALYHIFSKGFCEIIQNNFLVELFFDRLLPCADLIAIYTRTICLQKIFANDIET